jgi:hypothetical protein
VPCAVIHAQRRDSRTAKDHHTQCVKRSAEGWKDPRGLNWALRCRAHLPATWPSSRHPGGYRRPWLHHAMTVSPCRYGKQGFTVSEPLHHCAPRWTSASEVSRCRHGHAHPNWLKSLAIPINWVVHSLRLSVTHPTHHQPALLIHCSSSSSEFPKTSHHHRSEKPRRGQAVSG